RLFAVGTVELVDLRDALPWQAALQAAHLVALARERLLLLEQLAPGGQPLRVRDDWMIPRQVLVTRHVKSPFLCLAGRRSRLTDQRFAVRDRSHPMNTPSSSSNIVQAGSVSSGR